MAENIFAAPVSIFPVMYNADFSAYSLTQKTLYFRKHIPFFNFCAIMLYYENSNE
jgi:hypothetical protein